METVKPFISIPVAGHFFEDIQGERAYPVRSPFKEGPLPSLALAAISPDLGSDQPFPGQREDQLFQLSRSHARSFEVRFGRQSQVFWSDEFGNYFSTMTLKGNNLSNPYLAKRQIEPSGFATFGMQDSDSLVRILRVSWKLRENGVSTETSIRVIEPQELPIATDMVGREEFKNRMLVDAIQGKTPNDFGELSKVTSTDIPALTRHLDESTLVFTLRGMQVSERMHDLDVDDPQVFRASMDRVFKFVNIAQAAKAKREGLPPPKKLSIDSDEDIRYYFTEYLPTELGKNYGTMHNLGLLHVFHHNGNISAVGSIYDLDSVKGTATGCNDEPVMAKDLIDEASVVAGGVQAIVRNLTQNGFIKSEDLDEPMQKFRKKYERAYIRTRGWEGNIIENMGYIEGFLGTDLEDLDKDQSRYYIAKLLEQQGIFYRTSVTYQQVKPLIFDAFNEKLDQEVKDALRDPGKELPSPREVVDEATKQWLSLSDDATFVPFETFIDEDFTKKHSADMQRIARARGQKRADRVKELAIYMSVGSALESMTPEEENEVKEYAQNQKDQLWPDSRIHQFYIDAINNGDPKLNTVGAAHILMHSLYGEFVEVEDYPLIERYIRLAEQQTGWSYTHPENFDRLKQEYFNYLEMRIRILTEKMRRTKDPNQPFDEFYETVLNATYIIAEPRPGFSEFILDKVKNTVQDYYKKELDEPTDSRYPKLRY